MEVIQVDDVYVQLVELKKLIRVVDPGEHATLVAGGIRENIDFRLSKDGKWVEEDQTMGLSFATTMKKFKNLVKLKKRRVGQIDIYAVDEHSVHIDGLRFIHDSPGHASLVVTKRMPVRDLIERLEQLATKMEPIGRLWIAP